MKLSKDTKDKIMLDVYLSLILNFLGVVFLAIAYFLLESIGIGAIFVFLCGYYFSRVVLLLKIYYGDY